MKLHDNFINKQRSTSPTLKLLLLGICLVFVAPVIKAESVLRNISTRGQVGTGQNVLIGGFIISGQDVKTVMIRALGPKLATSGISGVLADPTVEIFSGSMAIAFNDDWRDTQEADIQNTGIAPTDSLESSIIITLVPGAYTAIVRGLNNTTGIGIVEVFDISNSGSFLKFQNQLSQANDECLDGNQVIAGAPLGGASFMDSCANVRGQRWQFIPTGSGFFKLQTQLSQTNNECLEGGSFENFATHMASCANVTGQVWRFTPVGDGFFQLQTQQSQGINKCLEANQVAAAFMADCDNNVMGQRWQFLPATTP
jgi:hypothetical protein